MGQAALDPLQSPVSGPDQAERLLAALTSAMADLALTLDKQTALIGAGRLREGLAEEPMKKDRTAAYMLRLQHAKANVVALARFAPEALRSFRAKQAEFERTVDRSQTVIATARTVSESLIRSLAEEVDRATRPLAYGQPGRGAGGGASPLVFSGQF